jgi:hypothetical protein
VAVKRQIKDKQKRKAVSGERTFWEIIYNDCF